MPLEVEQGATGITLLHVRCEAVDVAGIRARAVDVLDVGHADVGNCDRQRDEWSAEREAIRDRLVAAGEGGGRGERASRQPRHFEHGEVTDRIEVHDRRLQDSAAAHIHVRIGDPGDDVRVGDNPPGCRDESGSRLALSAGVRVAGDAHDRPCRLLERRRVRVHLRDDRGTGAGAECLGDTRDPGVDRRRSNLGEERLHGSRSEIVDAPQDR